MKKRLTDEELKKLIVVDGCKLLDIAKKYGYHPSYLSKKISKYNIKKDKFLYKANKIHNNKYDYSLLNYTSSNKKVDIICPLHGLFQQTPDGHIQGKGCQKCGIIKAKQKSKHKNSLEDKFPILCLEWSIKNILLPSEINYGSERKVIWKCQKCENEWIASVHSRTNTSSGCPNCKPASKKEEYINQLLKNQNINYKIQYRIKECKNKNPLPFDFAIFDENNILVGLIEYNGEQHYIIRENNLISNKDSVNKIQKRDKIKQNFCKEKQISLLIITYKQSKHIEEILNKFLKEILCQK